MHHQIGSGRLVWALNPVDFNFQDRERSITCPSIAVRLPSTASESERMDKDISLLFSAADGHSTHFPTRSVHLALLHQLCPLVLLVESRDHGKQSISSQFCGHHAPTRRSASLVLDCNTNRERGREGEIATIMSVHSSYIEFMDLAASF